jgi:hypothetical protein
MTNSAFPDNPLFANPWSGFAGWNSATVSAVGGCVQACAEACVGWQQEMAQFSQQRLAENQRAWAALLSSRDLASIVKVQHEWGLQAATDYTREATRLAQLATSLSLTGTTPAVQETANINA